MGAVFGGERALLAGCLRGERGAWDEFVRRYSRLVYWSIGQTLQESRFFGRGDLTGDIFQDVFQKIFEKKLLARLDEAGNIKKYLVVLSAHLALDRIKSISRLENKSVFVDAEAGEEDGGRPPEAIEAPPQGQPDQVAAHHEKRAVISGILDGLGAKERACLELDIFDGKSHREIGLILGVSQGAVSSIIRRTKNKVRQKLLKKGILE